MYHYIRKSRTKIKEFELQTLKCRSFVSNYSSNSKVIGQRTCNQILTLKGLKQPIPSYIYCFQWILWGSYKNQVSIHNINFVLMCVATR